MLKKERQEKILAIIKEKKFASVEALSKILYVSLPTIRRDLAELHSNGLIVRNHGGAMIFQDGLFEIPLDFRNGHNIHDKLELCQKAAKLISDGDVIFIDASTTTMHIADFITAKNITVVTYGMPLAISLTKKNIKTFLIGGEVMPMSFGAGGNFAEDFVSKFNYNQSFFSSYGINERGMIVDTSLAESSLRKKAFETSNKTVYLYTKDKSGLNAPYNIINIKDVDCVITC